MNMNREHWNKLKMWLFVCVILTPFPLPWTTCWMTSRVFFFKSSRMWMVFCRQRQSGPPGPIWAPKVQIWWHDCSSLQATQLFTGGKSCWLLAEKENLGHHWVRCQKFRALNMNDHCFPALIIRAICDFVALSAKSCLFFIPLLQPSAYRTIWI